jgi:hypothetical protein
MNMRLVMLSSVIVAAQPLSANVQAIAVLSDSPDFVAVTVAAHPGINNGRGAPDPRTSR